MNEKVVPAALGIILIVALIYGAVQMLQSLTANPEEKFLAEVHARVNVGDVTDAQLLAAGHGACELLDGGVSLQTVAESFRAARQPADFASVLVGAAVRELCPRHEDVLK